MVWRACSLWPCLNSHLGVSGQNRQVMIVMILNRIWQATGKRHWKELLVCSVAKHSQEAVATPMMINADCTTKSEPRFAAGKVSDCRIGTATVLSPTPTPAT